MNFLLIFASLVLCSDATSYNYPTELSFAEKPYKEKLDELIKLEGSKAFARSSGLRGVKKEPKTRVQETTLTENITTTEACEPFAPGLSFKGPKIGSLPILTFEDLWSVTKTFIEHKVILGQSEVSLRQSIRWRRKIVQLLIDIFRKVTYDQHVPAEVVHVARELVLTHFEGVKGFDEMKNKEAWESLMSQLWACEKKLKYVYLIPSGAAKDVVYFDSPVETNWIAVPEEYADQMPNLDLSIEILWYLFSFSLGACYKQVDVNDRLMWAIDYFQAFHEDFIKPIVNKWETGFSQIDQAIMYGDFNVLQAMKNLRATVSAIYAYNGIVDRQLNRPMSADFFNRKTGRILHEG